MGPLRRLRKSGCWFFYLDQRRVFTPYQNKADAEAWRYRHLAETAERTTAAGMEGCTVGDLLQIVEDDYASHNKRSIASLRSRLKRLRAEFKDVRAADLDEATIAARTERLFHLLDLGEHGAHLIESYSGGTRRKSTLPMRVPRRLARA